MYIELDKTVLNFTPIKKE